MVDLAEYVLYQCIKQEEHAEHNLKKITYSFEILDDCNACDSVIGNFFGQKLNKFFSKSANSSTIDRRPRGRSTFYVNHSYIEVFDDGKDGYVDDDEWLQPEYDKDNDVLQLMVSKYSILYSRKVWQSWQITP